VTRTVSRSAWVRIVITAAALALILQKVDAGETMRALGRLRAGPVLIVLGLLALDRAVMVWRWVILLRATRQTITPGAAVRIHLISSFIGNFLPAGVGADVARVYSVRQQTASGSGAAASVAVDRLFGLLSIGVVGLIGLLAAGPTASPQARALIGGGAVAVGIGTAVLLWTDRWMRAALPARWHATALGSRVLRMADALSAYRGHRGALAAVAVLSVAVQLLRILQAYVLGLGIGITVGFRYYLLFMPLSLIVLMMPISISGFGIPQAVITALLQPRGVPEADGFALSTLIVLSGIVANLPGALLYLTRGTGQTARERNG
jgi:glycosyltransferase 2 family protein